jgi:cell division protein FtsB
MKSTSELKKDYLESQKQLAASFAKYPELAAARIEEAERVVNLSDKEFLDYVQDWTCISN